MKLVRTQAYKRALKKLKAKAADIEGLESYFAEAPEAGSIIPGLHGVRKIRFRIGDRGKSGGGRAIYYVMLAEDVILMLYAYAKTDQEDISPEQRRQIIRLMKELQE